MKYISTIIIWVFLISIVSAQIYPIISDQILIEEDCEGEVIEGSLKLYGPPADSIQIFNIHSKVSEIEFKIGSNKILKTDTIVIQKHDILDVGFSFKNDQKEENVIHYSTHFAKDISIPMHLGSYCISHMEVESGRMKTINIRDNCSDSIRIYFPYGGTITGVTVHKSEDDLEFLKSVGYGIGDTNNYLTFGKNEIGKYFVSYAACWWGEDFWLEIVDE